MKCLVTGSKGFVAGYLIDLLKSQGHSVYGFDIKDGKDFRDYEQVRTAIDDFRPDKIFHIGALAYVPESFLDPYRAFETDLVGSLNILEAVRRLGLKTKIHLCGSSEEYGDAGEPVNELSRPNPLSPYAIAKLSMDYLGQLYPQAYGMHVVVTRTFNHTGPGRGEQYAESAWAKQIAEIERGEREILQHGNLDSMRNYTDVRDIVRAYTLAIDLPSGVYNICSDQNLYMHEVLSDLIGMARCPIDAKPAPELFRPRDFSFSKPECTKFQRLTKWKPDYKLTDTLSDTLEYWRHALEHSDRNAG